MIIVARVWTSAAREQRSSWPSCAGLPALSDKILTQRLRSHA
jgi:hypothetical protein